MIKENIKIIFCVFVMIISFKLFKGKKPPDDTRVMVKFVELKSLTPDMFNNVKITNVKTKYSKKIFTILFFIFSS